MGGRPAGFQFAVCVPSGATGEETSDARPAEPGAGGSGDAVPLWAAGPPHQGADAAGRADLRDSVPTLSPLLTKLTHVSLPRFSSVFSSVAVELKN